MTKTFKEKIQNELEKVGKTIGQIQLIACTEYKLIGQVQLDLFDKEIDESKLPVRMAFIFTDGWLELKDGKFEYHEFPPVWIAKEFTRREKLEL